MTDTAITFQLSFDHVKSITSDNLQPDRLTCKMNPHMFKDPFTGDTVDTTSLLEIELPKMMDKDYAEELETKT